MVITFPASSPANGPRPIDPGRDFPQLARLLKTVFADELARAGQSIFDNASAANMPALLWRFDPILSRLTPGFVWEEDGRIVGNVTLLTTKRPDRFLVANVAIDADYRRRGIARSLMEIVQKEAFRRGGREIRLQVERENDTAKLLYQSLGYSTLGTVTSWKLARTKVSEMGLAVLPARDRAAVVQMPRSRWRDAYRLDQLAQPADLNWPEPLAGDDYRRTRMSRIADFLGGRHSEIWMAAGSGGELQGIATIDSEWGKVHQLRVRVRPEQQGVLESALVHKLLTRLLYLPTRQAQLLHNADDAAMNEMLPSLRFRSERTLTQMRLDMTH